MYCLKTLSRTVLCFWILGAHAAELYVAPGGDDAHPGTVDKPFATLAHALEAARAVQSEPVTLNLGGGVYRLSTPIRLGPADSRAKAAPLVIRAQQGGQAVLSGGRVIGGWKVGKDGIWRTTIESVKNGVWKFNELFVDGVRATRARYPNDGYLRIETVGEDKRTSFHYATGDLPKFRTLSNTELVFLHDWSISRVRVASIDSATRTLYTAYNVGIVAKHGEMDHFELHPRYFLENNVAFLDAPGEWFLDNSSGVLSYKPFAGQQPDKVEVIAPVLTRLLEVEGQPNRPIEHLRFENIRFEHCAYDFGERYAAGQATFHEEMRPTERVPIPAAVTIDYGQDIALSDVQIAHVGGTGIWIDNRSRSIEMSRMLIQDTGGNGLMIGSAVFKKIGEEFEPVTSEVQVADSVFEEVGQRFFGAVAVWIGMSNHVRFEHNLVRYTPYTGISVGWRWNADATPIHDIVVANNHIHHNMQILSDGGGIYTLGRMPGSQIIGNVIHDIPRNAGRAESNGIFFDVGTSDLLIADNVVFNTDRAPFRSNNALDSALNNISRDNLLVYPPDQSAYRYNGTKGGNITKQNDRPIPADQFDSANVKMRIQEVGPR